MKKNMKVILAFILVFFLMQFISSITTEITIKTLPNHEVQLTIFKTNTADFKVIQSFKQNSDEYGDAVFTTSTDDPEFDMIIFLKDSNGKTISSKNFTNPVRITNNPSGEPIYLEMAPDWFTFIDTPTNETNTTEKEMKNLSATEEQVPEENTSIEKNKTTGNPLTSLSISEEESLPGKTFYYGAGIFGFLLVGFALFIITRKTRSKRKMKGMEKLDNILDSMDTKTKRPKTKKEIMQDVKSKMKEVENEIEELKE